MSIFTRSSFVLSNDDIVQLTPRGVEYSERINFGGTKGQVYLTLKESGNASVRDLSEDTRVNTGIVKKILQDGMNRGYVRKLMSGE